MAVRIRARGIMSIMDMIIDTAAMRREKWIVGTDFSKGRASTESIMVVRFCQARFAGLQSRSDLSAASRGSMVSKS